MNGRPRAGNGSYRPKKTAMMLAQRIVSEIADQRLPPSTPLMSEKEMVEAYGVARGTLREALRFLEIQGVITIKTGPGGGPMVGEPASRHLASTIAMMLQLDGAPFRAVLEARGTLEPWLARKGAERTTPDERQEIRASVERMEDQLDDHEQFLVENEIFHDLIAEAAGNRVFSRLISSLNWICDGSPLGVEYPRSSRESVARQHATICRAIEAGDGDAAERAMAEHIARFARYLGAYYGHILDARLRWDQVS